MLCRESAQAAQQATEAQEAEADLNALCKSNSAQVQSLAAKSAYDRQLRLEAQALREAQQQEQQAAQMTQEREYATQELRRQAEEQPAIQETLWTRQLSQQSTYKAEIHELCSICGRSLRCSRT